LYGAERLVGTFSIYTHLNNMRAEVIFQFSCETEQKLCWNLLRGVP
jgi:hypothetical protein